MIYNRIKVYAVFITFVVGWWLFAFKHKPLDTPQPLVSTSQHLKTTQTALIDRHSLLKALGGDFAQMANLIVKWDIDAQLLQNEGYDVRRLPKSDFLRSQQLSRSLSDSSSNIKNSHAYKRFLPQTYVAASLLLALSAPNEIVALPKRLREQVQIYPKTLTDQIPLDIDRHYAEQIFLAKPDIAFVAHYSDPAMITTLAKQGIVLYTMKNPSSLEDITDEIINVGKIINRPHESELLKIFMEATLIALDNHIQLFTRYYREHNLAIPRVLFLNYHQTFSVPTTKTLTGQLMQRLKEFDISHQYVSENNGNDTWMVPIDKERLINLAPDCLIIAAESPSYLEKELKKDPAMQQLEAVKQNRFFVVDEAIQHSPSQYIILAYYDLAQGLTQIP